MSVFLIKATQWAWSAISLRFRFAFSCWLMMFFSCAYWPVVYFSWRNVYSDPLPNFNFVWFFNYFFKDFIYLFLERRRNKKERVRNISVWLPLVCPQLGTWPTTQACALTGNQTCDPLVHSLVLNPLSHTSQGWFFIIELLVFFIYCRYKFLVSYMICKYFLLFCGFSFHFPYLFIFQFLSLT